MGFLSGFTLKTHRGFFVYLPRFLNSALCTNMG